MRTELVKSIAITDSSLGEEEIEEKLEQGNLSALPTSILQVPLYRGNLKKRCEESSSSSLSVCDVIKTGGVKFNSNTFDYPLHCKTMYKMLILGHVWDGGAYNKCKQEEKVRPENLLLQKHKGVRSKP